MNFYCPRVSPVFDKTVGLHQDDYCENAHHNMGRPDGFPQICHVENCKQHTDSDLCKIHLTEPVPDFALVLVEGLHEHCKRKGEQNQRQERQVGSNQIVL